MTNSYEIQVESFEEQRPLSRPRDRWENNIKSNVKIDGLD